MLRAHCFLGFRTVKTECLRFLVLRRLSDVIKECIRWQVICVDPEHLCNKEWRAIMESPTFQSKVLLGCINEVHLINFWGLSFCTAFATIGAFLRGRFPVSMSIVNLTATLKPGPSTISVCKILDFFKGNFKFIRRSNERPNTQFTFQFITKLEVQRHLNNRCFLVGANISDILFHRY